MIVGKSQYIIRIFTSQESLPKRHPSIDPVAGSILGVDNTMTRTYNLLMPYKPFFIASLITALVLSSVTSKAQEDFTQRLDNLLGEGYKAAAHGKKRAALSLFREAENYARELGNWRGLLDVGNAYAVLESRAEGVPLIRKASEVASKQSDWRGLVASGYSLMVLKSIRNSQKFARDSFIKAKDVSYASDSWYGLVESAKGFIALDDRASALDAAKKAATIAREKKDPSACRGTARVYQRLGQEWKARQLMNMKRNIERSRKELMNGRKKKISGQKTENTEKDIARTNAQIAREKREKEYFLKYWNYYGFPFASHKIPEWGTYYLRYYKKTGDVYTYTGP